MRISLIAFGTRGDVTPLVALGVRLRAEGHSVSVATHRDFEKLVTGHGLEFHGLPGSFQDLVASAEGRRALGVPRCTPLGLGGLFVPFRDCAEEVYRECWDATANTAAIVCSPVAVPVAGLIAQARDIPLAVAQAIPAVASGALPQPAFPPLPLGRFYNRATHALGWHLVRRGAADVFRRWTAEARRLAPEAPARALRAMTLAAVSPIVVERPRDWPATAHVTGYWFLPKTATLPVREDLVRFINDGPAPICFGFGSMMDDEPDALRAIVLEALERLNLRAVIVGGSGGALSGFAGTPRIFEASFVDYDWLFPRVRAVVHQGGAGTASFCLTAGVPQVIVPYCLDHIFWSWRMRTLGVAPPHVLRSRLTAPALATAIHRAISDPRFGAAAAALAPAVRAENGLDCAMSLLGAFLDSEKQLATAR